MRQIRRSFAVRTLTASIGAVVLLLGPLGDAASAAQNHADAVEVYGDDVFVIVGSTLRHPTATTSPDAVLFTSSGIRMETGPTDPVTWGEWSAASATSTADTIGGPKQRRTDVRIRMSGLVPGGTYSIFWGTLGPDSEQPLCPRVERTLPLDALHADRNAPDRNSFVAGASGASEYRGRVDGALLDADQVFFTVVFHFLGESSYPFPNIGELRTQGANCRSSFGDDSMRHLLILQQW